VSTAVVLSLVSCLARASIAVRRDYTAVARGDGQVDRLDISTALRAK
jgi:hypothetical protein